jgi:MraZ protein
VVVDMLIGEFTHALDAKGRVSFPAKLREELGDKFYITKGLDDNLYVYSEKEWGNLADYIRKLPFNKAKDIQHFFFSGASEAEPDKQGRINIPPYLRSHAKLDKDVTIIGAMVRAEIWDAVRWAERMQTLSSDAVSSLMDQGF